MPADQGSPSGEVLAALVASLRGELAQARAELARARERIAELEARLRQTPRELLQATIGRRAGQAAAPPTVLAEEVRAQAGRAGRA